MMAQTTPAMIVALGNAPCQPHSADGSSRGSTAGRFADLREFLATLDLPSFPCTGLRCHIVAQHGQRRDDDEVR